MVRCQGSALQVDPGSREGAGLEEAQALSPAAEPAGTQQPCEAEHTFLAGSGVETKQPHSQREAKSKRNFI